jgi:hypothetical protein
MVDAYFVAPAFRRALWNQADARLKAGATRIKTEFSRKLVRGRWFLGADRGTFLPK